MSTTTNETDPYNAALFEALAKLIEREEFAQDGGPHRGAGRVPATNRQHFAKMVRHFAKSHLGNAPVQSELQVKPLEWHRGYCDEDVTITQATTLGGVFQIRVLNGEVWLDKPGSGEMHASAEVAVAAAQIEHERLIRSALAGASVLPPAKVASYSQEEFDETYDIGRRDGYEEAVQDIDQKTGGDGEYRVSFEVGGGPDDERHTPDAPSMIQRIVDRFEALERANAATNGGRADQPNVQAGREAIDAWLEANCGAGIPFAEATDRTSMLHGLAYVLRQIESTSSYKVHIGQCGPATSALRMALDFFAQAALANPVPANVKSGEEGLWRFWNDKARALAKDRMRLITAIQSCLGMDKGNGVIPSACTGRMLLALESVGVVPR